MNIYSASSCFSRQGVFWGGPSMKSSRDSRSVYTSFLGPFSEAHCLAKSRNRVVSSSISTLLCIRSPSAVLFKIAEVVVYSIKSFSFWAFPHVREKVLKNFPCVAHSYASSTVVKPTGGVFVCASSEHTGPSVIGFGEPAASGMSVSGFCLAHHLTEETPARLGGARSKHFSGNHGGSTAFARTIPGCSPIFGFSVFGNNRESTILATGHINSFCHSALLNDAPENVHGGKRCSFFSGATLAMQAYYNTDGTTVLYTASAWEDTGGTIPYRGQQLQRLDPLT